MKRIIELRHLLHMYPELSNKEIETSAKISEFIKECLPDEIINIAGTGKAFVFNGNKAGKSLMFRAELDALQINEENSISYISKNKGVAHLCGHDGHMAILAGLALKISQERPEKGRVILLFQPAEEMFQGAKDVVEDLNFQQIRPDLIFALHNIPGVEKHKILLKDGNFAAASKGMTVKLIGKTSHAAEPEKGINPATAISEIIADLEKIKQDQSQFEDYILLTIIHIRLGEIAFGTSPGYAELRATLRAFSNKDMDILTKYTEKTIHKIARDQKLGVEITYSEDFPAVINDSGCINMIRDAAEENKLPFEYMEKPFRWSEDFAYFTRLYKGAIFGLGSGIDQPQLHNPDFDFPDDIIDTGIKMFYSIYKKINF